MKGKECNRLNTYKGIYHQLVGVSVVLHVFSHSILNSCFLSVYLLYIVRVTTLTNQSGSNKCPRQKLFQLAVYPLIGIKADKRLTQAPIIRSEKKEGVSNAHFQGYNNNITYNHPLPSSPEHKSGKRDGEK